MARWPAPPRWCAAALAAAVLATAPAPNAQAADLTAKLSATSVLADQPVQLSLSSTGPLEAELDLAPLLPEFHIIDRADSRAVSTINGRRSERHEVRLTLLARRTGTLTVPALSAGDLRSQALQLRVAPATTSDSRLLPAPADVAPARPETAPTDPEIRVTARVQPRSAQIGQQVLLTATVRSLQGPPTGRLHTPDIAGARVLPLGAVRRIELDQGAEHHIYEGRFAIFPEAAGSLEIPPLRFDAWRVGGGAPVSFSALGAQVEVASIPADRGSRDWLPARALSMAEAGPSAVRLAPGQTIERTITLRAEGQMAEDLPPIPLQIPSALRISEDVPRLWNEYTPDGVVGYRIERVLLGAAEPGVFSVPSSAIPWWNTQTRTWEQAVLPAWELTVAAFASEYRRPPATWDQPLPDPAAGRRDEASEGAGAPDRAAWADPRAWLSALTAVLVLLGVRWLARRGRRDRNAGPSASRRSDAPNADALDSTPVPSETPQAHAAAAVEQAFASGNAAAAREALLAWAALRWPAAPPGNLAQLAQRLPPPLKEDVHRLEKAFFSPRPIDWSQPAIGRHLAAAGIAAAETQTKAAPAAAS